MKTTIEIPDDQWAKLREKAIAAGYDEPADLVGKALDGYLERSGGSRVRPDAPRQAADQDFLTPEEQAAWPAMLFLVHELRRKPDAVEAALSDPDAEKTGHANTLRVRSRELPERWRNTVREYSAYLHDKPVHGDPDDDSATERLAIILSLAGSISDETAEEWKANIRELRSTWR